MPYVITTSTPSGRTYSRTDCRTGYIVKGSGGSFACRTVDSAKNACAPKVSRVAVATLDEARDRLNGLAWHERLATGRRLLRSAAVGLTESGGTVGPLPDGTIIEVSRVSWLELDGSTGMGEAEPIEHATHVSILAAFNAS